MSRHYPASEELIVWAQSLSGMLTKIETRYCGIAEMVESHEWDDNATLYFQQLIRGLKRHIETMEQELEDHVSEKYG